MLVRFLAENYLSFKGTAEFSMVASAITDEQADLISDDQVDGKLLPVAALYGANASGKSNFLASLDFLRSAIRRSHKDGTPDSSIPVIPFALDPSREKAASRFEIEFLLGGSRHVYKVELNAKRILKESLQAYPLGRPQLWFQREGQEFEFGKSLRGENRATAALTRENSLFLSAAATNNHEQLSQVFTYFSRIRTSNRDDSAGIMFARWYKDYRGQAKVLDILKSADIGVCGVSLESREQPKEIGQFISEFRELLKKSFKDLPPDVLDDVSTVRLQHAGAVGSISLDFNLESAGTKAFIGILPAIVDTLDSGGVLILDELVEALHPILSQRIVGMFQNKETNPKGAQFIFSTHDTNLLNVLRRDQVWFTQKNFAGESKLFPLTDFKTRKDDDVARDYLRGRYGALPFIEHLVKHDAD